MSVPPVGPLYLSPRSADAILSDVRPIKLAHDALQAVNVLLDELLYTILSLACSLTTDKLKVGLLKAIPTSLGKEALLEAEVELKAYWERNSSSAASGQVSGDAQPFDLQWNFELLRMKCEAYSTMNDSDEDPDAERRLKDRFASQGSRPPVVSEVAPAALYLTAILESICEHILSNVSSVATRDSSRTIASIGDVFLALCEDNTIYNTFRSMKVHDQMETLSKNIRPRRSKSFSRASDRMSPAPSTVDMGSLRESTRTPSRLRMSSESLRSSVPVAGTPERRPSLDKRKKKFSHSRSSSSQEAEAASGNSRGSAEFESGELLHEFDELMRSGTTMKVSLTPDRLKTMEVYNKERTQRSSNRRIGGNQFSDQDERAQAANGVLPERQRTQSSAVRPSHVESIIEDEEDSTVSHNSSSAAVVSSATVLKTRQPTKSFSSRTAPAARTRSISVSDLPQPRQDSAAFHFSSTAANMAIPRAPQAPAKPPGLPGMPPRTRRVARNPDSMDLDSIMAGSDGEDDVGLEGAVWPTPPRTTPNSPLPSGPKSPGGKSHISQSARDLIAFLDEGPPEDLMPQHRASGASASVLSFESSKPRPSGRFSRMMSRLTVGTSTERLNGRDSEDTGPKTPRTPRLMRKASQMSLSPPAYKSPSLSSKRSFPNVVVSPARSMPPPIVAAPPLPASAYLSSLGTGAPPMQYTPSISAASTASTNVSSDETSSTSVISPRRPNVRKAVPPFHKSTSPPVPPLQLTNPDPPSRGSSMRTYTNGASRHTNGIAVDDIISMEDAMREAMHDSRLSVKTNGYSRTPSPAGRESPATPRRSPISRKPPPSPIADSKAAAATSPGSESKPVDVFTEPATRRPGTKMTPGAVEDLRRLLSSATSADECRLLVDMFFASHGFPCSKADPAVLSLPPLVPMNNFEASLVELFLGEMTDTVPTTEDTAPEAEAPSSTETSSKIEPVTPVSPVTPSKYSHTISSSLTVNPLLDDKVGLL